MSNLQISEPISSVLPQNPTVLIVEDDEQLSRLYRKALNHAGYRTIQAYNSSDAMYALDTYTPDVMLVDMKLEDGDSRRVIHHIKDNARFTHTQIIVVSGAQQYQNYAEGEGVEYFLQKPVSIAMLTQLVERVLFAKAS